MESPANPAPGGSENPVSTAAAVQRAVGAPVAFAGHAPTVAQAELETHLGRRVHLMLHVKVREDWIERPDYYRKMGLEYDA